jgi:hypothetical protein
MRPSETLPEPVFRGAGGQAERFAREDDGRYVVRRFVTCARGKISAWWEILDTAKPAGSPPTPVQKYWTRLAAEQRVTALNVD